MAEGTGGVVNELLVQMQSFEEPTGGQKLAGLLVDRRQPAAAARAPDAQAAPPKPNVLIVAATNRADSLDPALLRPGRFDRRLTFDLPAKASRRQLIDHFLIKRSHGPELDDAEHRDALAAVTSGLVAGQARAPARRGAGQRGAPRRRADELEATSSRPGSPPRSASARRSPTPSTSVR